MTQPPLLALVIEFTAGVPLVVTGKDPAVPAVKEALLPFVNDGAVPALVTENDTPVGSLPSEPFAKSVWGPAVNAAGMVRELVVTVPPVAGTEAVAGVVLSAAGHVVESVSTQ